MALRTFADPDIQQFRQRVRRWLPTVVPPAWSNRHLLSKEETVRLRRQWDHSVWEGGFSGLTWPPAFGGQGLGALEEFTFYDELAAHAPEGLDLVGRSLVGPALMAVGTHAQQERYLPGILRGQDVWCEGFSEPNAGSDLAAVTTVAVQKGDRYFIEGRKIWTSNAHLADRCYLLAKTVPNGRRHHNLGILLVDMCQPGVQVSPIRQTTGAEEFDEVRFNHAVASEDELLGEVDSGWALANLAGLRSEGTTFHSVRRYTYLRETYDQLCRCEEETGAHQQVKELGVRLDALRWHMMRATELRANARSDMNASSVLRLWWGELWQEMTEVGITMSCPNHHDFWRLIYLEARPATIYGGTSEIQRNVISERVLRLPRESAPRHPA